MTTGQRPGGAPRSTLKAHVTSPTRSENWSISPGSGDTAVGYITLIAQRACAAARTRSTTSWPGSAGAGTLIRWIAGLLTGAVLAAGEAAGLGDAVAAGDGLVEGRSATQGGRIWHEATAMAAIVMPANAAQT